MRDVLAYGGAVWQVTGEMAPYLLLGFLLSGVLHVFVSAAWVRAHLGGRGLWPILKAALIGVPLPLCSCGVLPVAASLRAHGASRGATLSFLISTPQTGVDSILATQALLGPVFVVFRVVTAFVSGILGGALLDALSPNADAVSPTEPAGTSSAPARRPWSAGWRHACVTLPRDIGRALLLGMLFAGALTVWLPPGFFADKLGPGLGSMLVMMAVGIPLYVCSTGSIPLAFAFLSLGVTPGAALVFLITGPATNAAAITTIWRFMGRRALAVYLATIALTALAAGILLDLVLREAPALAGTHIHDATLSGFDHACALILVGLLLPSLRPRRKPAKA